MIPKDPDEININASPQGLLELAEYFSRRKMEQPEEQEPAKKNGKNND